MAWSHRQWRRGNWSQSPPTTSRPHFALICRAELFPLLASSLLWESLLLHCSTSYMKSCSNMQEIQNSFHLNCMEFYHSFLLILKTCFEVWGKSANLFQIWVSTLKSCRADIELISGFPGKAGSWCKSFWWYIKHDCKMVIALHIQGHCSLRQRQKEIGKGYCWNLDQF